MPQEIKKSKEAALRQDLSTSLGRVAQGKLAGGSGQPAEIKGQRSEIGGQMTDDNFLVSCELI